MFLMFGLGSKKPWESLVFRFWGFGGGVWRLCSLPVDWSRYWHPGRERPCARELGFDRPEPVAKALVSVGPVCVALGGSVLPMLKPQNLVRFPVLGSEPHAPHYCQNCVFWEPPITVASDGNPFAAFRTSRSCAMIVTRVFGSYRL